MPNGNRGIAGSLTIGTSTSLTLNGTSGDLYIAKDFANNGTFTPSSRAVFFNGSANSTISGSFNAGTGSTTNLFNYLIFDKSAGDLILGASCRVEASAGSQLQINNAGQLDLNGNTMTVSGAANFQVTGSGRVIKGSIGSVFSVSNTPNTITKLNFIITFIFNSDLYYYLPPTAYIIIINKSIKICS
jgi:hypothetical protein